MISKDGTNEHDWSDWPVSQPNQEDAFTAGPRTNSERARNDPRSCKTPGSSLLRVAASQLARLDPEDRAALRPHVERDMEACRG
jgi:hypothetical protein